MKNADLYKHLTNLAYTDPMAAGQQFKEFLMKGAKSPRKRESAKCQNFLRQLDKIMSGDTESWQYSSKNLTDAIHFILTNFFLGDAGLGVLNVGPREDIAQSIAAMVTESIDYAPMTPEQKQLKSIAESLGYSVYLLETAQ